MPQSELLSLLAVCVGFTVSAIASQENEIPAALLAQAVNLDMHDWWTPTAAGTSIMCRKPRHWKQSRCSRRVKFTGWPSRPWRLAPAGADH